jgi:hypothetical protein
VKAYKLLTADGLGPFSQFRWPLPEEGPGDWVAAEVATCRSGIHACRAHDLPYWIGAVMYEVELDGRIDEQPLKLVAPRGRLVRHVDRWDEPRREEYGRMCFARAHEFVAESADALRDWAPSSEIAFTECARLGFIAALLAELVRGTDAHLEERRLQGEWLVEHLALS